MKIRALIFAAACLALAGCWRSQTVLLNPAEGVRAIPDGAYAKVGGDPEKDRIVWKGGGWYELQDEGSISIFTLTPLGEIGGRPAFAAAMADDGCQSGEAADCEWDYGVVFIEKDAILVSAPDCKDSSILARRFGATPTPDDSACGFTSGTQLKAALAEYAQNPAKPDRFVRK